MQDYSTIVGIIDMRLRGISYGDCCARYNSTITRIMSRSGILNSGLEDLKAMNPEDVETIFYPPENVRRKDESIMPDYGAIYERITRSGSKANLYFMWDWDHEAAGSRPVTRTKILAMNLLDL